MRIETSLLLTKVGRRIVVLFGLCALLPILVLALISDLRVSKQLVAQGERRLHGEAKGRAMSILERLTFLDQKLSTLGEELAGADPATGPKEPSTAGLSGHFTAIAVQPAASQASVVWRVDAGSVAARDGGLSLPPLDADHEQQLFERGRSLLVLPDPGGTGDAILMGQALAGSRDVLWGALDELYLWFGPDGGDVDTLRESDALLWILGPEARLLFTLKPRARALPAEVSAALARSQYTTARWSDPAGSWMSRHFFIPVGHQFLLPHLTVVQSESRRSLLGPVFAFRRTLVLVSLSSVWVVLLLSLSQIRKSLVPLEQLRAGTKRIAEKDFEARVQIASKDEFEELGDSFNSMAQRLGEQFTTLTALHQIAATGLSSANEMALASAVLAHLRDSFPGQARALTLLDQKRQRKGKSFYSLGGDDDDAVCRIHFREGELQVLELGRSAVAFERPDDERSFLAPLRNCRCKHLLALPVFLREKVAAVLVLGFEGEVPEDDVLVNQFHQIAEQIGAALSHVRLFVEADHLYRGTLRALGRTIDAKSKWTRGHSERVTAMAVRIGRQLKLSQREIELINRGGQLHDIGKIGVPSAILDKPAKLTPEEFKQVQDHTLIGERILEPIPGFEDVVPMVGQHHECFDGSGYPRGLKGEEIDFYARLLAIADTFDALRSSRPYRAAVPEEEVVAYIIGRSGTQFDPQLIPAFAEMMPAVHRSKAG